MPRRVGHREGGKCRTCNHPERARIDFLLASSTPTRPLAARFGLSPASVFNHLKKHISDEYKRAVRVGPLQNEEQLRLLCIENGKSVLETLKAVNAGVVARWLANFEAGSDSTFGDLTGHLRKNLELMAKLTRVIVAGRDERGHGYVLEDLSGRYDPAGWARAAIAAYYRHSADRIVAEVNQGGDMVESTLRTIDRNVSYTAVHASRGKFIRAEPAAALYEQGRVHHVGAFPELEDQMTSFTADLDRGKFGSPDRVDALVWALTELLTQRVPFENLLQYYREQTALAKTAKDAA